MKNIFLGILTLGIIIGISCKKKATTYDCAGVISTYTTNIKPILDAKCATSGCHSSTTQADGIDLSSYGQAKVHATHDHFMGSIQQLSGYESMPKGGAKLSEAEIKLISCWISSGTTQ